MEKDRKRLRELLLSKSIIHGEFTLTSGMKSSYYVDGKMTTFDPEGAYLIGRLMLDEVNKLPNKIDSAGGPVIGADPIVTAIGIAAHLQKKPLRLFVVRKKTKTHGMQKCIEGNFQKGDRVVIVEDVITTGGSILQAIEAVEESSGTVEAVMVVVDRKQGGRENIQQNGYRFISLFSIDEL